MSKLEQLSRREFLNKGLRIAEAAATLFLLPSLAESQSNLRDIFKRKDPYMVETLPRHVLQELREAYEPTVGEQDFDKETLSKQLRIPKERLKLVEAFQGTWIKLEPDKKYAQGLIEEGKKSIDHITKFLGSKYIKIPRIIFNVPESVYEIKPKNREDVFIYLVSGLGHAKVAGYELAGIGQVVYTNRITGMHGETLLGIKLLPNLEIKLENLPILYRTTHRDIVGVVEAPAIEVLHKISLGYYLEHFKNRIRMNPAAKIRDLFLEFLERDEKFVHALSILWLRRYSKDNGSFLTEQEFKERFAKYETDKKFKGTNKLSEHISKIGIQKSIELYVYRPDELFKGAGLK